MGLTTSNNKYNAVNTYKISTKDEAMIYLLDKDYKKTDKSSSNYKGLLLQIEKKVIHAKGKDAIMIDLIFDDNGTIELVQSGFTFPMKSILNSLANKEYDLTRPITISMYMNGEWPRASVYVEGMEKHIPWSMDYDKAKKVFEREDLIDKMIEQINQRLSGLPQLVSSESEEVDSEGDDDDFNDLPF